MHLLFNRVHKNGWASFKVAGITGAVFVDKRMLTPEALASCETDKTIELTGLDFVEPKAEASVQLATRAAKNAEKEQAKLVKVQAQAAKAQARIEKLQAASAKAQDRAAAAQAKIDAGAVAQEASA